MGISRMREWIRSWRRRTRCGIRLRRIFWTAGMEDGFAGADVGGTSVKLAFGTADGDLLAESSIPTESHQGPEAVLKGIAEGINYLSSQTGAKPKRIGMGIPGIVDIPRGI